MKAARIHHYGGPEVITYEEAPIPEIQSDEILIKVAATSYNPLDSFIRSGMYQGKMPVTFPFTLASDVAGEVKSVGQAVSQFKKGDKVYGMLDFAKNGAAAEFVAAKAVDVAYAPKSIALTDAASVPLVALTAWQGLFVHANLKAGQRVLINAASGGVGLYAIQLAKLHGAYVIGTASPKNFDVVKSFGADEVIDYHGYLPASSVPEKVDVIFNLAPWSPDQVNSLLDLLNKGGILVSALTPADPALAQQKGVTALRMGVGKNAVQLKEIAGLIDAGKVKVHVNETLLLKDIARAHEKSFAGQTRGKIVIKVA